MTLVDYLSGLFNRPSRGPSMTRTGVVRREPSTANPQVTDSESPDGRPPYVYECRRCGKTVSAETTVCPRCDRATIAEYPVR